MEEPDVRLAQRRAQLAPTVDHGRDAVRLRTGPQLFAGGHGLEAGRGEGPVEAGVVRGACGEEGLGSCKKKRRVGLRVPVSFCDFANG